MVEESTVVFEEQWLYHATMPAVLVRTSEAYDTLMMQGGWASSPAAFGTVTAPNEQQTVLMVKPVASKPGDMSTGDALLVQLSRQVEGLQAEVEKMKDSYSEIDALHEVLMNVNRAHEQLVARVDAMLKQEPLVREGKR